MPQVGSQNAKLDRPADADTKRPAESAEGVEQGSSLGLGRISIDPL